MWHCTILETTTYCHTVLAHVAWAISQQDSTSDSRIRAQYSYKSVLGFRGTGGSAHCSLLTLLPEENIRHWWLVIRIYCVYLCNVWTRLYGIHIRMYVESAPNFIITRLLGAFMNALLMQTAAQLCRRAGKDLMTQNCLVVTDALHHNQNRE